MTISLQTILGEATNISQCINAIDAVAHQKNYVLHCYTKFYKILHCLTRFCKKISRDSLVLALKLIRNIALKENYSMLKRPLLEGSTYDHLIPSSSCKVTRLTEGDTYTTVNHMTDWVNKYYKQTARLSPKLQRATLKDTVDSIYSFLYNHIQYTADGVEQQLRSPACSWKQRHEGVDCKSYSIFASCILKNLGIDHYIRKVKQPNFHPEQYTHVYVIVPKKGKSNTKGNYYVIDATKHENTEVAFLQKKDIFMNSSLPHVGLNGVSNRPYSGLHIPRATQQGFEDFLSFLKSQGISHKMSNALRQEVHGYLNHGIDPDFDITEKGIIVNRKLFPLYPASGLAEPITTGTVIAVSKIALKTDFFKKTFGAIFANGFDVSCWGSSYNPSKAKQDVTLDIPFILQHSGLDKAVNESNFNKFMNFAYGYKSDAQNGQNSRFAKCTRKGHAVREQAIDSLIQEVMTTVKFGFKLVSKGTRAGYIKIANGLPGYAKGHTYAWGTGIHDYKYTYYQLVPIENTTPKPVVVHRPSRPSKPHKPVVVKPKPVVDQKPTTPTTANPTTPTGTPNAKDTSNASTGILLLLIASGFVFGPKIKESLKKKKAK